MGGWYLDLHASGVSMYIIITAFCGGMALASVFLL